MEEPKKTGKKGGQLKNKNAEKWTEEKALNLADGLINWLLKPINFEYLGEHGSSRVVREKANVFFKYYLVQNGLYDDLISDLCDKFPSFLDKIKRAKDIQEMKLAELGVSGILNPTMTIFMLKNHHDYRDKQEIDHTSKNERLFLNNKNDFIAAFSKIAENENLTLEEFIEKEGLENPE